MGLGITLGTSLTVKTGNAINYVAYYAYSTRAKYPKDLESAVPMA